MADPFVLHAAVHVLLSLHGGSVEIVECSVRLSDRAVDHVELWRIGNGCNSLESAADFAASLSHLCIGTHGIGVREISARVHDMVCAVCDIDLGFGRGADATWTAENSR